MVLSRRIFSCRSLAVLLALVANLVAAGVPVLHALAHEVGEHGHRVPEVIAVPQIDHLHGSVHADALHDERVMTKRQLVDLAFILPVVSGTTSSYSSPARIQHRSPLRLASRAPPAADLARAPPLA